MNHTANFNNNNNNVNPSSTCVWLGSYVQHVSSLNKSKNLATYVFKRSHSVQHANFVIFGNKS